MSQATPLAASKARAWLWRAASRPCSSRTAGAQLRHQPAQPADAAGQVDLDVGQQRLRLLRLAALDPGAGPGEAVAQGGQLLHRPVVEVGGQPQPLLLGGAQHRLHDLLALGLQGDLAGQAAHAGQGQQEQHHRAAGDHRHVDRLATGRLDDQHRRGHQRGAGQGHQPRAGQPRRVRHRLGQRHHRGVQGRQAERGVVEDPDRVERAADLPVAGDQAQPVHGVAGQQGGKAHRQQARGGAVVPARAPQPHRHRQQQHVAEGVGDRDQPLGQRQPGRADVGADQEHPRQHAEAGGDDGRLDQAGPVAAGGAGADQQQQPGRQQRVARQVEAVGHARVGRLQVEHPLVGVVDGVADGERELPCRQQVPRQRPRRPPEARAGGQRHHRGQLDRAVDDRPQQRRGQHEVPGAEDHHDRQEDARHPWDHAVVIGRSGVELLPSRVGGHGASPQMAA